MLRRLRALKRPRVVFVAQWLETFEIVEPVIAALKALGADVRIVVTPERDILQWSSDGTAYDPALARSVWTRLDERGHRLEPLIPPEAEAERLRLLSPDAVFVPSPYIQHRHESLAPDQLRLPVHYVNYGFNLWPEDGVGRLQFELPFFRQCTAIYSENDYCTERLIAAGVDDSRIVRSGHPALDYWDVPRARAPRPTVLWCPWWSTGNGGYSTFLQTYPAVLDQARRRPELHFVVRAHPLLWGQLRKDRLWSASDEADFLDQVARLTNLELDGGVAPGTRYPIHPDHLRQFERAWAMVTDGVSFVAEFAYTGKPILLTEAEGNQGWNEVGQTIIDLVERSPGPARLSEFLDRVERGDDPGRAARHDRVRSLFYRPEGGSANAIARYLVNGRAGGAD